MSDPFTYCRKFLRLGLTDPLHKGMSFRGAASDGCVGAFLPCKVQRVKAIAAKKLWEKLSKGIRRIKEI